MARALRRHHARVAAFRLYRIKKTHWGGYPFEWSKPWQPVSRCCMTDPNWWVHEQSVVPDRRRAKALAHMVERGVDPDTLVWPENTPAPYYW